MLPGATNFLEWGSVTPHSGMSAPHIRPRRGRWPRKGRACPVERSKTSSGCRTHEHEERGLLRRALEILYFMAPAYVANMSPPLVKYWRVWNRPISPRWLGSHKTVVGFAAGLLGAMTTTLVQHVMGHTAGIVDYEHWLELGLRFGVGAMAGDSVKSPSSAASASRRGRRGSHSTSSTLCSGHWSSSHRARPSACGTSSSWSR
jgi:hypothetical protein